MAFQSEISDQEHLDRLRGGDESALRTIFDRYYAQLLGDVFPYIQDEDTCQDLVQEVFVELWRKRSTIEIHTSLRAYLRRAAINRALNYIKVNRRTVLEETDSWKDTADLSSDEIQQQARQEGLEDALRQAIEELPEKCRLVFSLSRFEQLSHKEIAEQLGISTKTIENQITKAMRLLRAALHKYSKLSSVVILALKWWWYG
ncbi:MAG: RNA polymerase sigma-70 factor [Bacteroidetes bacterium]|nr:MAG: RNA polymerase sigma-70 factor [Bacteroidota bacterium]